MITRGQLFDFDDVEEALKNAILAACSSTSAPIQVVKTSETPTNQTPRVEIVLITQPVQGRRFMLNPMWPDNRMQPLNVWTFQLSLSVVCNREQNGNQLISIRGNARAAMQFCYLWPFIGTDTIPLHAIIDIQEQAMNLGLESIGNLDQSKLSFSGQLCIRDAAWSLVT